MNNFKPVSAAVLAGMALLFASEACHGLGFGRPTSRAILGETLLVTVPLRLEPGEELSNECLGADIYFGDEKVAPNAVTATLLPGWSNDRVLKVATSAAINEPVVTVYLVAGCKSRITRKFIALADPPSVAPPISPESQIDVARGPDAAELPGLQGYGAGSASSVVEQGAGGAQRGRRASGAEASTDAGTRPHRHRRSGVLSEAPSLTVAGGDRASAENVPSADRLNAAAQSRPEASGRRKFRRHKAAAQASTQGEERSRLALDPVEADALAMPALRMSPVMTTVMQGDEASPEVRARRQAAAAMWLALNATPEQQVRDRQRLEELEQRLAQLRQENDRLRQTAAAGPTMHNPASPAAPRGDGLTWALGALALVGVGSAIYFFLQWRQQRRHTSDWWKAEAAAVDGSPQDRAEAQPVAESFFPLGPLPEPEEDLVAPGPQNAAGAPAGESKGVRVASRHHEAVPEGPASAQTTSGPEAGAFPSIKGMFDEARDTQPAAMGMAATRPASLADDRYGLSSPPPSGLAVAAPAPGARSFSFAPSTMGSGEEPLREVSVEELIDLEQQAEFFVVLGQDEAAIDLLEGHVQHTTGASPLPFLKLLEIYRRLGRRGDYERVQQAFNNRFNAHAPSWEDDLSQGHDLEGYPEVIERLQSLWPTPVKAMEVLEKSLTRPESSEDTFELPAYRELLFLYAVARDLSEREPQDRSKVDLLLPVVDVNDPPHVHAEHHASNVEPLMATRPIKAQPEAQPSLSLDLHLDDLDAPDAPTVSSVGRPRQEAKDHDDGQGPYNP